MLPHLAGVVIERVQRLDGVVRIEARPRASGAACRRCGYESSRVHSRYQRRLADAAIAGQQAEVWLEVRRLFCDNTGCPARTFAEQVADLTTPYARRTPLLRSMLDPGSAVGGHVIGSNSGVDLRECALGR